MPDNKTRVAVGGFMHETNTFAPTRATFDAFAKAADRPPLQRGGEILENLGGLNKGIAGALEVLRAADVIPIPLVWTSTTPSGYVTKMPFERIAAMMVQELSNALPVDGIYLDLHGAMVAEYVEDGEGELLARVRQVTGPDLPIVTSLDLHANVTPALADLADGLVAYRTYPHVDMRDTGKRAAGLLLDILGAERRLVRAYRQIPFLIPLTWQCTLMDPARSIYARLRELEQGDVLSLSFTPGFPASDIWHSGPAVMAYGWEEGAVAAAADTLADLVTGHERDFAAACTHRTMRCGRRRQLRATRPVRSSWPIPRTIPGPAAPRTLSVCSRP